MTQRLKKNGQARLFIYKIEENKRDFKKNKA